MSSIRMDIIPKIACVSITVSFVVWPTSQCDILGETKVFDGMMFSMLSWGKTRLFEEFRFRMLLNNRRGFKG